MRRVAAVAVSAAALLLVGWASRAPYAPAGAEAGLLRLSWRHRAERAQLCRPRTQAELDALPVHMRTPEVCEERRVPYLLVVAVDGGAPDTVRVVPEGARHDRPVYVFRERRLEPGEHALEVLFTPEDGRGATLRLAERFRAAAGEVVLVTTAADGRGLVRRGGGEAR